MKPVPPVYPRLVPDIDFDEDPILPDTIVYAEDSDDEAGDAEEFEKRRAAKRRRIENNANAYLRGEGLFILSAGLRGPFDGAWDNPWARKGSKRKAEAIADDSAVNRARKMLRKDHLITQTPWKSRQLNVTPQPDPFAAARAAASETLTPEEKVKSWLRRSTGLQPQPDLPEPTSPTPKRHAAMMKHPSSARRDRTPTKQVITVNSQNIKAPQQLPNDRIVNSFETIIPHTKQTSQPVDTHARLQDVLQSNRNRVNGKHEEMEDTSRAEVAIKKIKADSRSGPDTAQKQHTESEFNLRKPGIKNEPHSPSRASHIVAQPEPVVAEVKLKKLETTIDEQLKRSDEAASHPANRDVSKDRSADKANGVSVPALDSNAPSTILPPSAQPRPELQTGASNVSSGILLLNQLPSQIPEKLATVAIRSSFTDEEKAQPLTKDDVGQLDKEGKFSETVAEDPVILDAIERVESSQPEESQQQDRKLPAPIEVSEGHDLKSVTNSNLQKQVKPSSLSLSKEPRLTKKRKSTTFAETTSFSSNESIKSALKVQKRSRASQRKKSPPPTFKQLEVDMDTSVELENPSISFHTTSPDKRQPSKSILKATDTTSAVAAAELSSMTQNKTARLANVEPDLLISGQDALVQVAEDNFDLDGAIDQMDSFLSTWDAEKNAIQI